MLINFEHCDFYTGTEDIDEIRAVRGFGEDKKLGEGEALSESDDEEPEEDADQLLLMELQNVQLTPDAWILLYGGIMSLVAIFVIVFFFLIKTTIQRECDNPWFSDTEHFTFRGEFDLALRNIEIERRALVSFVLQCGIGGP